MNKYVLVYQGGSMAETAEAQQAAKAAWGEWYGKLGSAVVDGGAPFGARASVGDGPSAGLSGYTILEAGDLDAAVKLGEGCPVLSDGGSVEVYETIDVTA